MFARLHQPRKAASRLFAFLSFVWLAACDVGGLIPQGANTGQSITPGAPVRVALLVPGGTGQGTNDLLASNLENAARLAISDLQGVNIDLRVYNTAGNGQQAASVAAQAVNDGAKIILGPLFGEAANAAGVAVAPSNVNVLAFSNNPTIAGGNVFILGATFSNTANRLVGYASRQGISRYQIVHGNDLQGQIGRDAIASAVRNSGGQVTGIEGYPLSQAGIQGSAARIAAATSAGGAQAVMLTAGVNADLPILATALPDAGISPSATRFIGLTRWNAAPQALSLPGLQGGLFAMPDQGQSNLFENRYAAAYGGQPHPLAGLAYDGIAAIGALAASGRADALTKQSLTAPQGFQGTSGIFRFQPNGLNERGLAVATIQNNQVTILEAAPRTFGGAGL
jgi:hypothetical protein